MRAALLLLAVVLSGCATCRAHRTACAVGATLFTGAAIAAVAAHDWCSSSSVGQDTRPAEHCGRN